MIYDVEKQMDSIDWQFRNTGNRAQAQNDEQKVMNEMLRFIAAYTDKLSKAEIIKMVTDFLNKQQFS